MPPGTHECPGSSSCCFTAALKEAGWPILCQPSQMCTRSASVMCGRPCDPTEPPCTPPLLPPQTVSPLLAFDDKAAEAEATAQLQRHYGRNDWRLFNSGAILELLLAWHMCRTCGWRLLPPVLAEAAVFAALYWLSEWCQGLYLRHRSLLLGAMLAAHPVLVRWAGLRAGWRRKDRRRCAPGPANGLSLLACQRTSLARRCCDGSATLTLPGTMRAHPAQVIKWVTPCLYGPSNPGPLRFWLGELNHCLVPWIMLLSLAYPVPLKVGAWAVLACAFRRHHDTLPLGRAVTCMPVYRKHRTGCGSAART